MRFGKKAAVFVGDTDDYVQSTWAPICGFNVVSCGLYSCCGFADLRTRIWMDKHLRQVDEQSNVNNTGSLGAMPPAPATHMEPPPVYESTPLVEPYQHPSLATPSIYQDSSYASPSYQKPF
mmetsp:Transcript_65582/g.98899  ORF Transcript_65582/g.98899 Transcript_65582/m.98899 type:complete len:121 (+) Transcript_65582:819-1181(+)